MSNTIIDFGDLSVTAFVGPKGDAGIQVTMERTQYVTLDSGEAFRLAMTILGRLLKIKGYRATD